MKKLGMFLLMLCLALFTVGCEGGGTVEDAADNAAEEVDKAADRRCGSRQKSS